MEIISSQSFLHENFLMARCLPCIILSREIGRKGHSGDSRFLHQQVPGILQLSVKFYSVGEFSRNNKRGKPPLEWKCYNFRAQIKQRKGFPHGYYNKNRRNLE